MKIITPEAHAGQRKMSNVVDLAAYKRGFGMIATSGSWRRHWLAWRAWRYPACDWVTCGGRG